MSTDDVHAQPSSSFVASRGLWSGARIALSIGLVAAGALVAYGLSESADAGRRGPHTPPVIAVVDAPTNVSTTQPVAGVPGTADMNLAPTGTADVAIPPVPPPTSTP